jgi:TolA-binding protein
MKKQLLMVACCLFSLSGWTQTQKTNATPAETRQSKKVELTAAQREKLTKIDRKHKADRKAIDNDAKISPAEKKIRIRKLQDEKVEKMMKVLGEEQRQLVESEKSTKP